MSSEMIKAVVARTRSTLDMMHRGNIAQAPNMMKMLVRAAEEINKLPEAAFVDAEYVKGALAANCDLITGALQPYTYVMELTNQPIIGTCNIHILGGKFLVAQAVYMGYEPAKADHVDDYINLLNGELDNNKLEDTIMFLANTLRLDDMSGLALNAWASENYVSSRKRGRDHETFVSADYTGVERKTLLNEQGVDAIIKDGLFNKVDESVRADVMNARGILQVTAISNRTKEQMEKIYADEAKAPKHMGPNRCQYCDDREACIMNTACGHISGCATCMHKVIACPTCREPQGPKQVMYVYISACNDHMELKKEPKKAPKEALKEALKEDDV